MPAKYLLTLNCMTEKNTDLWWEMTGQSGLKKTVEKMQVLRSKTVLKTHYIQNCKLVKRENLSSKMFCKNHSNFERNRRWKQPAPAWSKCGQIVPLQRWEEVGMAVKGGEVLDFLKFVECLGR